MTDTENYDSISRRQADIAIARLEEKVTSLNNRFNMLLILTLSQTVLLYSGQAAKTEELHKLIPLIEKIAPLVIEGAIK